MGRSTLTIAFSLSPSERSPRSPHNLFFSLNCISCLLCHSCCHYLVLFIAAIVLPSVCFLPARICPSSFFYTHRSALFPSTTTHNSFFTPSLFAWPTNHPSFNLPFYLPLHSRQYKSIPSLSRTHISQSPPPPHSTGIQIPIKNTNIRKHPFVFSKKYFMIISPLCKFLPCGYQGNSDHSREFSIQAERVSRSDITWYVCIWRHKW